MSLANYRRNHYFRYVVEYSFALDGERKRFKTLCYSRTPEECLQEVKDNIVQSFRDDFEMRVVGIRFY